MTHRILCTGSRAFTDEQAISETLVGLCAFGDDETILIVHGACPSGADALVNYEARRIGYAVEKHPADWAKHGKAAGFVRNGYMVSLGADMCLAFWDGESKGTLDCLTRAVKASIPVRIVPRRRRA